MAGQKPIAGSIAPYSVWAPSRLIAICDSGREFLDAESYALDCGQMRNLTPTELDCIASSCRATAELLRARGVRS